ncbi:hypothetical protein D1AOALGA4SA_769 [Olavius algarvensis Delta 1 endosymbiont]|nr:hypothetical protein D1AOALGA4SA_769 [Olavius algarvensis Delta 1 endosymbiont]
MNARLPDEVSYPIRLAVLLARSRTRMKLHLFNQKKGY